MADLKYYDVIRQTRYYRKQYGYSWMTRNTHSLFTLKQTKFRSNEAVEKMFEGTKVAISSHNELQRQK